MVTDDLSDSEALQEAIRQSLSESRGFHEESYLDSDSDSSQIMDLTAEGFSLVTNDNNTNRPLANQKSDLPIEDDIYAFFVEAGLENPEELQMLGIDIETIRAQKALEERIERESKRDYELARRLQSEFENEIQQASSSSQSTSWQPSDSPRDPPVSLKREIDRGAEDKKKKARLEPMNSIEIEDDSDEEEIAALIRMTQEESVKDYLSHVPWNTYDPEAASSAAAQKRKYKTAIRRHGTGSGGNFDVDMDPNRPRMYVPPFPLSPYYPTEDSGGSSSSSSLSGYGHEGNRNLPLALRQQDHMSTIVNQVRQESFDSAFRNHQISNEEVEKELRTLLENITDDEPPPPEDRTGTPDKMSITLLEHQKIGLQWMSKMEASTNKGGILADDMGLGKASVFIFYSTMNELMMKQFRQFKPWRLSVKILVRILQLLIYPPFLPQEEM